MLGSKTQNTSGENSLQSVHMMQGKKQLEANLLREAKPQARPHQFYFNY